MRIDPAYFEVDGVRISWGQTLAGARQQLEGVKQFEPYGGWPNLRCKAVSVFDLPAIEFEARAPYEDRPIMQVQYEVAPQKNRFFEKRHQPYLRRLKQVLGRPVATQQYYDRAKGMNKFKSGVVVFSATWLFDDIRISLSVYGGDRDKDSGICAAGIYIDWIDEVKAAMPYREAVALFEKDLNLQIPADLLIQKFQLQQLQKPFSVPHFELSDPYIAQKDPGLRAAQLTLYQRNLFPTPTLIQEELYENEVGYCCIPAMGLSIVCTKWDATIIRRDQYCKMNYWNIHPARGPGGQLLDLNGLKIEDEKNALSLLQLVLKIESDSGLTVEKMETYDD